jgi:hypothetical protein
VLVEVDVAADVAALLAVVRDLEDLLLRAEVEVPRDAGRIIDELEPGKLEVAHPRVPCGLRRRGVR